MVFYPHVPLLCWITRNPAITSASFCRSWWKLYQKDTCLWGGTHVCVCEEEHLCVRGGTRVCERRNTHVWGGTHACVRRNTRVFEEEHVCEEEHTCVWGGTQEQGWNNLTAFTSLFQMIFSHAPRQMKPEFKEEYWPIKNKEQSAKTCQ